MFIARIQRPSRSLVLTGGSRSIQSVPVREHYIGFGGAISRVLPRADQISTTPRAGFWYATKKGDVPARIARTAYGAAATKTGLLIMNRATWNDHVKKGSRGWEAYKVNGLQLTPNYSGVSSPRAGYGSGRTFPVLWIPPLTGQEPEAIQQSWPSAPVQKKTVSAPAKRAPAPPQKKPPAPAKKKAAPAPVKRAPAPPQKKPPAPAKKKAAPAPVKRAPAPPQGKKRILPRADQISTTPRAGYWYAVKKGDVAARIARTAYGAAATKSGLMTMNRATWNDHVRKGSKGWEAYKVAGLQLTPNYAGVSSPRAGYGSGSTFPVLWIPPLTGQEPEAMKAQAPAPKAPAPPQKKPTAPGYEPAADEPGYEPAAEEPGYEPAAEEPGYEPAAEEPGYEPGAESPPAPPQQLPTPSSPGSGGVLATGLASLLFGVLASLTQR